MDKKIITIFIALLIATNLFSQHTSFEPGKLWLDNRGEHINAHGAGFLFKDGTYYMFGEYKDPHSNEALVGVSCYSSKDLYNWRYEGIALSVDKDENSPITSGCVIERPKVIYNKKNNNYVMYFHLELKDKGYSAALYGVATSNQIQGPYKFLYASRSCKNTIPLNKETLMDISEYDTTQTNLYSKRSSQGQYLIERGQYFYRDMESGQMSRDMTLYVDDDDRAYHVFASENNQTLHIVQLTEDYQSHTSKYIRVLPGKSNEAPAIFKAKGKYWMISSDCTGWDPNPGRLAVADSIMGEWVELGNPFIGENANKSFFSQSTFVLKVDNSEDEFIYIGDRWMPDVPMYGRYVWLPITFENGIPQIKYHKDWTLDFWKETSSN